MKKMAVPSRNIFSNKDSYFNVMYKGDPIDVLGCDIVMLDRYYIRIGRQKWENDKPTGKIETVRYLLSKEEVHIEASNLYQFSTVMTGSSTTVYLAEKEHAEIEISPSMLQCRCRRCDYNFSVHSDQITKWTYGYLVNCPFCAAVNDL